MLKKFKVKKNRKGAIIVPVYMAWDELIAIRVLVGGNGESREYRKRITRKIDAALKQLALVEVQIEGNI